MTKAEFLQALQDEDGQTGNSPKWMEWVLSFAQKNLDGFKKAEWDKLANDLRGFCLFSFNLPKMWKDPKFVSTPGFLEKLRKGTPKELKDRAILKDLHCQLRKILGSLIPQNLPEPEPIYIKDWIFERVPLEFRLRSRVVRVPKKDKSGKKTSRDTKGQPKTKAKIQIQMVVYGNWPTVFWLAIGDLLERNAFELNRCEECRTLFVQTKQQAFCSIQCGNRYRGREWYRTHFNDPEVIKTRHGRYEKKIRATKPDQPVRTNKRLKERSGRHGTQERKRSGHFGMAPKK